LSDIRLRPVKNADLPVFFEHQRDPESSAMAAVPARDRATFERHWAAIRHDESTVLRTVLRDGDVAGNLLSWSQDGARMVGYRIGREHWGRGVASAALAAFLAELDERPLHATVSPHNGASQRVLEKCGFELTGRDDELLHFELR
jgi:RimJ/RimL family protein N-acetyltransferase